MIDRAFPNPIRICLHREPVSKIVPKPISNSQISELYQQNDLSMSTALSDSDRIFAVTNLENVMIESARPTSDFGILNLKPNSVTAPPEFTELATLQAMRNLKIIPGDLVPQDPPQVDDLVLRLHLTIELERRRYETINRIIAERNRILSNPIVAPVLPRQRKRVRKRPPDEAELSQRRERKRELPSQRRNRRAVGVCDEPRRQVRETILERAQIRLEKVKRDGSAFEKRKRQLKEEKEAERQRQERSYMRLQERKQRALEAERRWRRENVYRGAGPGRKNRLADLKEQLERLTAQVEVKPDPPPRRWFNVSITRPVAQRNRYRLPVIGRGRTKIPCLRRAEEVG
jgi:hypothetical protein